MALNQTYRPGGRRAERPLDTHRRAGHVTLTAVAAVGALTASAAGLLTQGAYPGEASTAAMFRGYDLVTLFVALVLAGLVARPGRGAPAVLVRASLLAYLVYTYAYLLFGTGFNDLLLLHVAVFSAAVAALGATVPSLFHRSVTSPVPRRGWARSSAGLLGGLAAALCAMWVYVALDNAVTGTVPAGSRLVETDTIVHLGIALDLALLVPWYATAAVLLWRGRPTGYPVAFVALVAGLLHQASYMVALPFQVSADVPGATATDPGEPVIVLVYAAALAALVAGRRSARQGRHT